MIRIGLSILLNVHKDCCWVLNGALPMLEPCEVKVSRRVLRGLGASDGPRLLDNKKSAFFQVTIYCVYGASKLNRAAFLLH